MRTNHVGFIALALLLLIPVAEGKKKPPRFVIQVVAEGSDKTGVVQSLYIILPDGSHARATCFITNGRCGLESFAPEKRKAFPCGDRNSETAYIFKTCFAPEAFYASRQANELTIADATGSKVYHIAGSYDDSELQR